MYLSRRKTYKKTNSDTFERIVSKYFLNTQHLPFLDLGSDHFDNLSGDHFLPSKSILISYQINNYNSYNSYLTLTRAPKNYENYSFPTFFGNNSQKNTKVSSMQKLSHHQ